MKYRVSDPCLSSREIAAVSDALRSGWITQGPTVAAFEVGLSEVFQVSPRQVVACSSGTAALHLAIAALGLGPGDEILVPDLTYVATANAVAYVGATPVLVDVDAETWAISLSAAEWKLTARTKAIVVVHLYGVAPNMTQVVEFARRNKLLLIEDAAEAFGGAWQGQSCGTFGDAGTFSFYGNKILTTGEGGAVVVKEDSVGDRARHLRGQAMSAVHHFFHDAIGFNYRMTEMQAAVGMAQLQKVQRFLNLREALLHVYQQRIATYEEVSPLMHPTDLRTFAPWLFAALVPARCRRDVLQEKLAAVGIETRPAFCPLHRFPMFLDTRGDGAYPNASRIGDRALVLPLHPKLLPEDVAFIASAYEQVVAA